jgi:fucose permease
VIELRALAEERYEVLFRTFIPPTRVRMLDSFEEFLGPALQFFYVGAQVGVASFVIRFTQFSVPGTAAKVAAMYLTALKRPAMNPS